MLKVPTVKLSSGRLIPTIGLGFWLVPKNAAAEVAYQGLKTGFRLLDSAQAYRNEHEVAQGILRWLKEDPENNKRQDVVYTSKVWTSNHGYKETKASLEESLKKAKGLDYIDIMLVHQPHSNASLRHGTWKALEEAVAEGKVKSIGVSNYGIKPIKELLAYPDLKIKPALNQLELHPGMVRTELTEFCKKEGILAEAYSPLMHGNKLENADLVKLAKKYGKTPSQILLRWSIQMGFVPIPKTNHVERIKEDFDVFDFELTADEVKQLSAWKNYYPFHMDATGHWSQLLMSPFVVSRYMKHWMSAFSRHSK